MSEVNEQIGIRRARMGDALALGHLRLTIWQETYPGILPDKLLADMTLERQQVRFAEMIDARSDSHGVFCAEAPADEGALSCIAYGICGPARAGPAGFTGEIHELYVLSDWYGQGVGWALMSSMAGWLAGKGHETLFAAVLQQNHAARAFYTRIGGERCGEGPIVMGGTPLVQEAFGWRALSRLTGRDGGSGPVSIGRQPNIGE